MKQYFWTILVWLDQGVNVIFAPVLNRIFNVRGDARFGSEDETLSSVFGKNTKNCKLCKGMCKFLALFEEQHCKKSIEEDENAMV